MHPVLGRMHIDVGPLPGLLLIHLHPILWMFANGDHYQL
jgi:hypothetical protein